MPSLVLRCDTIGGRGMTEVSYGNPETMSATQDLSSHEILEGMVSTGPSPCSDASFGGTVQNPVENAVDPMAKIEDCPSGNLIPESKSLSGESSAGHGEVTLLAEKLKVSYGADDYNITLGIPYQYLRDIKGRSTEESLLDAPESEFVKNLPAVEESTVQISALETTTVKPSALESSFGVTSAMDNLIVDTPVIRSTNETHAEDTSTVEIRAMEFSTTADLKEESAFVGEYSQLQDLVQDVVPGVIRMGVDAEDVIMKDKSTDEVVVVEQQPLPGPFKNEGQGVTSKSIPVLESPLIGIVDACQTTLDEMALVQNGESRMDEEVPATNCAVSLSTTGVSRVENEVDNTTEDTTGRTVKVTAEKLKEDMDDKLVDEMSDRMANKLANGMADRMADAIAEEIADQIADRMADEIADKMADEMADEMVDGIADAMTGRTAYELADKMADEMTDRMADEMADRMADEMADRMADEMAAEVADELAAEVGEAGHGRGEGHQNNVRLDDGENLEVGGVGEEEMGEDAIDVIEDDGYEDDDGSPAEQMSFVQELERFFKRRNLEYKAPKFYGLELNVLKLWRVVSRYGGYDHVTVSKLWRTVGEEFKPPKTCTTISWSFRGFYEKALLEYERLKTGFSAPDSCQRTVQTIGCYLTNDQRTASPATPSSDPNMGGTPRSGSGRARRDAASRAMQGWHFQRMGNGDAKETSSKDKGSGGKHVKKEKKLTNLGGNGLKRKGTKTVLERAVKAVQARGRPRLHEESPPSNSAVTGKRSMKQQDPGRRPMKIAKVDGPVGDFDPPIVDEGPKADWVKINVHKHLDCFEIYALVPGLAREEVRIQCEPGGRLVIAGMPEDPENPWGVTPFRKVICLPSRIDAHQTSAVVTLYGQLYVRVPIAEDKSS